MRSNSEETTRKSVLPRKRSHRVAIVAGTCLAVAGLVTGGGFAVQSAVAAQDHASSATSSKDSAGLNHAELASYRSSSKAPNHSVAEATLGQANQVLAANKDKVDVTTLTKVASALSHYEKLPHDKIVSLTAKTKVATASVNAASAEADRVAAEKAESDRVAAEAAAAAAAQAEADRVAAEAAAAAPPATPEGAKATAAEMAASRYGWGADEMSCLDQLWDKESGWDAAATNPSSGATGIPQALPGNKMASAGADWATNPATQIAWGLDYIKAGTYGTPCAAWAHSESVGWY